MGAVNFAAVVTDIRLERHVEGQAMWQMTLEPTRFLPGDTGTLEAVARSGTRLHVPVLSVVRDDAGLVWLTVEKPLAAGTDVLATVTR